MRAHDPKVLRARLEELATVLPFELTTRPMMGASSGTPTAEHLSRSPPAD